MTDERRGAPSASKIERYHLCPGSFRLEKHAPPQPASEDATSGTRIHAALASEMDLSDLTTEERETADACHHVADALVEDIFSDVDPSNLTDIRERRYWCDDPLHSGKPDLVVIAPDRFLVLDYKTGRNEVAKAADNLQIRALIGLVFRHHYAGEGAWNVVRGFGAVVQPWVKEQCSSVEYSPEDIQQAIREVDGIIRTAMVSDNRVPGQAQCKYCPCKVICENFKAWAGGPVVELAAESTTGIAKGDVESRVVLMPGETLAMLLDLVAPMKWMIDAAQAEAKRRIEEGDDAPPGWTLKPGSPREKITDVESVFGRLSSHGVSAVDFTRAVSITKSNVKGLLRGATRTKGRELDDIVAGTLDGCTTTSTPAPSLVRED